MEEQVEGRLGEEGQVSSGTGRFRGVRVGMGRRDGFRRGVGRNIEGVPGEGCGHVTLRVEGQRTLNKTTKGLRENHTVQT